jgi:hypothetical protein
MLDLNHLWFSLGVVLVISRDRHDYRPSIEQMTSTSHSNKFAAQLKRSRVFRALGPGLITGAGVGAQHSQRRGVFRNFKSD